MPIAQRDSEVELAAMNGDLARRGTCLCLVWAHPHPYPLIIIILVVIVIFVIFITIIMVRDTRHLFVCPPTLWEVLACLKETLKKSERT